jgi:hypothetical protein
MKGPNRRRRTVWCAWHNGLSDTAQLVRIHEAASGPGGMLYACAKCRIKFGLAPLAERTI